MNKNFFIFGFVPVSVIAMAVFVLTQPVEPVNHVIAILAPAALVFGIFAYAIRGSISEDKESSGNVLSYPHAAKDAPARKAN